jgi:glycine/D-amino acid oxidase-like deaminating enzyme
MSTYVERNLWRETAAESFAGDPLEGDRVADLAIVGGGFTGCSAALHAAEQGVDVRLLEADCVGHGGSGRNVGLVNAGLWMPPDDIGELLGREAGAKLNRALARAPDLVFSLIERHGIDCHAVRNGTLHCAHSKKGLAELRSRLAQQLSRDAPVTLLDAEQTRKRTGTGAFHGALFDERAGTIEPFAYCQGLARAAREQGARIHESSPVTSIRHDGNAWHVQTAAGSVTARALLLATNAYHHLDTDTGMAEPAFTPVHFFQFATRPLAPERLASILPGGEGCWDTGTVMSAFRRDHEGRLLVGSIGALDHAGSAVHRGWARRKLATLFPDLKREPLEYAWHGRIAMTADHLPKIVRLNDNGLMIFGYSGRGIGPGTLFGQTAAEAIVTGNEDILPLAVLGRYSERNTGLRRRFFEAGAVADHVAWMGRHPFA